MQWYYAVNNERRGPVTDDEFQSLVASGVITSDTLVWTSGMNEWQPYSRVTGTTPAAPTAPATVAPVTQAVSPTASAAAQAAPVAVSPGGGTVPGPFGYGGFWRRFLARLIDGLILGFFGMFIGGIAVVVILSDPENTARNITLQILIQLFSIGLALGYDLFFIRKYDATPGKMAIGLKLLRADGSKLSPGRIVGRYFSHILSGLPLAIGYIMAAFDDQKRALHDHICDTRVIRTQ